MPSHPSCADYKPTGVSTHCVGRPLGFARSHHLFLSPLMLLPSSSMTSPYPCHVHASRTCSILSVVLRSLNVTILSFLSLRLSQETSGRIDIPTTTKLTLRINVVLICPLCYWPLLARLLCLTPVTCRHWPAPPVCTAPAPPPITVLLH